MAEIDDIDKLSLDSLNTDLARPDKTDGNQEAEAKSAEAVERATQRRRLFAIIVGVSLGLFVFDGFLVATMYLCQETREFVKAVPVALLPISLIMVVAASMLVALLHSLHRKRRKKRDKANEGWLLPADYLKSVVDSQLTVALGDVVKKITLRQ